MNESELGMLIGRLLVPISVSAVGFWIGWKNGKQWIKNRKEKKKT